MRNYKSTILLFFVCALFAWGQERSQPDLGDSGLTPESPFYFLDVWDEKLRLLFTISRASRLQRRIDHVHERLSEAYELAGRGIAGEKRALELYQEELPFVYVFAEQEDVDIIEEVLRLAIQHTAILDLVSERTPFAQKQFVIDTKQFVIDEQFKSLEYAVKENPEVAFHIYRDAVKERFRRLRAVARDKENNEEALREYLSYISEAGVLLDITKNSSVGDDSPHAFMKKTFEGHEEELGGFIRERVSPVVELDLVRALHAVRELYYK